VLRLELAETIVDSGPESEAARAADEEVPRADRSGIQKVEGSALDHHILCCDQVASDRRCSAKNSNQPRTTPSRASIAHDDLLASSFSPR
jgi:hypothetical protein